MTRKIFFEVLLIVFTAILLAFTVNQLRPDGLELFSAKNTDIALKQITPGEISITEAIKHFHTGSALFVDARSTPDFNVGHIHGAINLTNADMDEWIDGFLADTSPDTLIIAYCDGPHCPLGQNLSEQLRLLGYTRAYYMKNGWSQWKRQDMPMGSID